MDVLSEEQRRKTMQRIKGKNPDYWIPKISRNRQRDEEVNQRLLFEGWTVIRFWGKEIQKNLDECVRTIEDVIDEMKWEENELEIEIGENGDGD